MKLQSYLAIACLSILPAAVIAQEQDSAAFKRDDGSFEEFLQSFEAAISQFMNGDPTAWKKLIYQGGNVTIMGAWGAYEKGWPEVSARYDWAAARFRPSGAQVRAEYLSKMASGNLAQTVAIERADVLIVGQDKVAHIELRVTHLFRKEKGVWKLVHRHADPLMNKTNPGSVLH